MIDLRKYRENKFKFSAIHHEDYALWIYLFKNNIIVNVIQFLKILRPIG